VARLRDGAVLLSTSDEVYYGLNAVGAQVWERLPPVLVTFDELCASLAQLYPDVAVGTIQADLRELLDDLDAHGLVTARTSTGSGANHSHASGQADQAESRTVG
jgi:hypothetical protein